MPFAPDSDRIQQELQLLRFLCLPAASGAHRTRILGRLSRYSWREPDHQVIFEALFELSAAPLHELRALLPGQLTRKGFPDISLDVCFQPPDLSPDEAEELAHSLGHAAGRLAPSRPDPAP
jgi:hypothetical protein